MRARVSWPRSPDLDPGPGAALLVWHPGEGRGAGGAGLPAHRLFAEAGLTVLSVPWPARPTVTAEAAVQDAATALEWAADHAVELDADPARLLVAGEGLGAGLAAAVCLHARDQGRHIQTGDWRRSRRRVGRGRRGIRGIGVGTRQGGRHR